MKQNNEEQEGDSAEKNGSAHLENEQQTRKEKEYRNF